MRAPQADRPVLLVPDRKNQAMCGAVDQSVCPITGLTVVEAIVINDRQYDELDPSRERYVMLREVDRFLGWVEINHLSYIQFVREPVKRGAGAM
jgi:hypothetical protein